MTAKSLTILLRRHRIARWQPVLWLAVAGLAVEFGLLLLEVDVTLRLWAGGGFAMWAIIVFFVRRPDLCTIGRRLDRTHDARNRFEALAEIAAGNPALGAAIAASADAFLCRRRPAPPYAWIGGWILVGVIAWNIGTRWRLHSSALAPTRIVAVPGAPLQTVGEFSLLWFAPEVETTATPGENLPLLAEAVAPTGLRDLQLHVSVNGKHRLPLPLVALAAPGRTKLSVAMALGDLGAEPNDVVAYSLSGEPIAATPSPRVRSPLQFIRIISPAPDLTGSANTNPERVRLWRAIRDLREYQGQRLRDIARLEHAGSTPAGTADAVAAENFVHESAMQLASEASTARSALHAAALAVQVAAETMAREGPAAAAPHAGEALKRLAEAEQSFEKPGLGSGERRSPPASLVGRNFLPPRGSTPAGRLEKAAADQEALVSEFTSLGLNSDSYILQDRVFRQIEALKDERVLAPVKDLLVHAAANAQEAAMKLEHEDNSDAIEPAVRSAQMLTQAVKRFEEEARARGEKKLAALQRTAIEEAVRDMQTEEQTAEEFAEHARRVAQALQDDARLEQELGSAAVAFELQQLSEKIAENDNGGRVSNAQWLELAQHAADARRRLLPREAALAEAQAELRRIQSTFSRSQPSDNAVRMLHQRSLALGQMLYNETTRQNYDRKEAKLDLSALPPAPPGDAKGRPSEVGTYARELSHRVDGLLGLVDNDFSETQRNQVLATGNPDEVPPTYQAAVAEYFEALTRADGLSPMH